MVCLPENHLLRVDRSSILFSKCDTMWENCCLLTTAVKNRAWCISLAANAAHPLYLGCRSRDLRSHFKIKYVYILWKLQLYRRLALPLIIFFYVRPTNQPTVTAVSLFVKRFDSPALDYSFSKPSFHDYQLYAFLFLFASSERMAVNVARAMCGMKHS